jgi:hypothetical protein
MTVTSIRCFAPVDWARDIAARRSFFACLHGLHRFGSFFNPLSWKNTCSPVVQVKCSPQSTQAMDRS